MGIGQLSLHPLFDGTEKKPWHLLPGVRLLDESLDSTQYA